MLQSVHPRTGAPGELCCRINGSLPAASLAAVGILTLYVKPATPRFRGLSPGLLRGGRLKCAVNLVLLVISEVSGWAAPENSIDGKFLELA